MGLQYFLEMVDLKHRYGANLRVYHEEWKKADTNENFFYWLDHGEGRLVDIDACPREQLEREQVRYLTREERQYYLVTVDHDGRLCWAKNGARIDTSERFRDSIHGIVPVDDPTPPYAPVSDDQSSLPALASTAGGPPSSLSRQSTSFSSLSSSAYSASSSLDSAQAARYTEPADRADPPAGLRRISHHLSATGILNKMLRKTVRRNTWIFVADTSFRLYVGIKNSGAFQHSSFLRGSRISAAGLIRVRDGRLAALSPLSGHYRPPASSFRAFVRALAAAGVDMSHVRLSKSYAVLVGLEMYARARERGRRVLDRVRHGKGQDQEREQGGGGKEEEEEEEEEGGRDKGDASRGCPVDEAGRRRRGREGRESEGWERAGEEEEKEEEEEKVREENEIA